MDAHKVVAGGDQEQELLALIQEIDWSNIRMVEELFQVLKEWWVKRGESTLVTNLVCEKMQIDPIIFSIYRQCSALISLMEPLRKGEPVRSVRIKLAMSEDACRWWVALLIVQVLLKCDGLILHSRLLRWLGHKANCQQVRAGLAVLNENEVVHTFQVTGNDLLRPITWHRLVSV